jgi:hypothetical protein
MSDPADAEDRGAFLPFLMRPTRPHEEEDKS